jgi:hypothetical protein
MLLLNTKMLCQEIVQLNGLTMKINYALFKFGLKKNPQLKAGDFFKFLLLTLLLRSLRL